MMYSENISTRFANEFGGDEKIDSTTRIKADVQEVQDIITRKVEALKVKKQEIKDIKVGTVQGFLHLKAVGGKSVKIQVRLV